MKLRSSRHAILVVLTLLINAGVLVAQPDAVVANPAHVSHKSMSRTGAQAVRDRRVFFPAPRAGASALAPRGEADRTCDVGDDPMIC